MLKCSIAKERRQGPRRFLLVELLVRGRTTTGEILEEPTMSEEVSVNGGCLQSWVRWEPGNQIVIASKDQTFIEDAVVKNVRPAPGGRWKVGFQFSNYVPDWILTQPN